MAISQVQSQLQADEKYTKYGNYSIFRARARASEESIFDKLARQAFTGYELSRLSAESLNFFHQRASRLKELRENPEKLFHQLPANQQISRFRGAHWIGKMLMYKYDPKTKDTLPYYDIFPLIFIVNYYNDGFLGINLHYLPHIHRAVLFKRLQKIVSDQTYDDDTRLRLSYQLLNGVPKFAAFKPCLKRYLWNHVRSKFLIIPSYDWEIAIFLPTHKFQKASVRTVWADSKKEYQL
jgi:hypothetical protein